MSLIAAAQITAVATAVLAAFAIVTAVFAVLAWRNQSAEVSLQRKELERAATGRRRAQASHVFIWHDVKPGEDAVQNDAMGPDAQNLTIEQWPGSAPNTQIWLIVIHVRNTSEQPVYDLVLRWRTGSADWKRPEQWPFLEPDANEEHTRGRAVPPRPGRGTLESVAAAGNGPLGIPRAGSEQASHPWGFRRSIRASRCSRCHDQANEDIRHQSGGPGFIDWPERSSHRPRPFRPHGAGFAIRHHSCAIWTLRTTRTVILLSHRCSNQSADCCTRPDKLRHILAQRRPNGRLPLNHRGRPNARSAAPQLRWTAWIRLTGQFAQTC